MKVIKYIVSVILLCLGFAASAMAADDTTIADATTALTTGFGLIKTLVVSVVMFGLIIGYVKLLRKK